MTNRSKTWLVAAAVALAGIATAPAFAAVLSGQFAANKIAVVAPASPDELGTIWFDLDGTQGSGASFGGPH